MKLNLKIHKLNTFLLFITITKSNIHLDIIGDITNNKPQKMEDNTMMKTNERIEARALEIESQITAFDREKYDRLGLLDELLKLQEEMRILVFNDEHAKNANLRIWNVVKQLELLNKEKGHIVDVELENVIDKCRYIGNLISALISGVAGERKANFSLLNMKCRKRLLKNIELSSDGITSELDNVVVTSKGIFLIEVKNTGKDIFIDENGNYYRKEKKDLFFDCNIGEKINYKEQLLKNAIGEQLKDHEIHSLLVFTNSNIRVNNLYKYVEYSFLGQLPHLIDEFDGADIYSEVEMDNIVEAIEKEQSHKKYPVEIDMREFIKSFADLLATLELGEALEKTSNSEPVCEERDESDITYDINNENTGFLGNVAGKIVYALAGVAVGAACVWAIIKK